MTENRIFGPFFRMLRVLWDHQNRLLGAPKTASKPCLSTIAVTQLKYSLFVATFECGPETFSIRQNIIGMHPAKRVWHKSQN